MGQLTDIQLAVRGFMSQSDVSQIRIMKKYGYNKFDYKITILKNQLLFIEFLKESNKCKEWIEECKLMYPY